MYGEVAYFVLRLPVNSLTSIIKLNNERPYIRNNLSPPDLMSFHRVLSIVFEYLQIAIPSTFSDVMKTSQYFLPCFSLYSKKTGKKRFRKDSSGKKYRFNGSFQKDWVYTSTDLSNDESER